MHGTAALIGGAAISWIMANSTNAIPDWVRGCSHHAEIAALDVCNPLLYPAFWQDELVGVFGFDDTSPNGLHTSVIFKGSDAVFTMVSNMVAMLNMIGL